MVAQVNTVAFEGVEARHVGVQVQISPGVPAFTIVGLGDKAVAESRERVRGALTASGLAMPPKRITVNLAPADLPKEGSHYDLPIALALMTALGVVPQDAMDGLCVLGELGLDGSIAPVTGALPAAIAANASGRGLVCPDACGPEAAWAGDMQIIAPATLLEIVNHIKGTQTLPVPRQGTPPQSGAVPDMADIKGQETAKRALEVAAAGGHNLLFVGPPGAGKSMLASRLSGILPPMGPREMLDVAMVASVAGILEGGALTPDRPFRAPHHSASMAALVGGGIKAKPGEVSLAHNGVLFLDELAEFARPVLDALRQPLETGAAVIARANHHVSYPARFQLVAAMNPCRCGYASEPAMACGRLPRCAQDYQTRVSGPLMDRIDIQLDVPPVAAADLRHGAPGEPSAAIAARVKAARARQASRYAALTGDAAVTTNAQADGQLLEQVVQLDTAGLDLMDKAAETLRLSARGYVRVLRVARTLADLDGGDGNKDVPVTRAHLAEALSFRRAPARAVAAA
ncbi:MAG: YifB family Mg chelatase-like AAA ATPase [Candidatus Phaeomarinobacter sp.]